MYIVCNRFVYTVTEKNKVQNIVVLFVVLFIFMCYTMSAIYYWTIKERWYLSRKIFI